jgi:hypothetical protein
MNENKVPTGCNARLATIEKLRETTLAAFLDPVPPKHTIRDWFRAAKIPCFKSNPLARKGGGAVYYSVSAVEKFLRARLIGGNDR